MNDHRDRGRPARRPGRHPGELPGLWGGCPARPHRGPTHDQGVATVWAAVGVSVIMVALLVGIHLGAAVIARHRAEAAADLAALAAASAAVEGTDAACGRAGELAAAMGASITFCRLVGWDALVEVQMPIAVALPGVENAGGRARAGPVPTTQERLGGQTIDPSRTPAARAGPSGTPRRESSNRNGRPIGSDDPQAVDMHQRLRSFEVLVHPILLRTVRSGLGRAPLPPRIWRPGDERSAETGGWIADASREVGVPTNRCAAGRLGAPPGRSSWCRYR